MKLRASVVLLALLVVGLPMSHLDIEPSDDSWLLRVDGRPVDVAGYLSERYTALTRRCHHVQVLRPTDPVLGQVLAEVQRYSPPDSLSAQIVHATRQGPWVLAQVQFRALQPAVLLLKAKSQGLEIAEGGIWSGPTHPHRPEPVIRRYLQSRVPTAPTDLTDCFAYQL